MSKLSKQDKIDIYNNWKHYHKSLSQLGREYRVRPDNLYYLIRLIDLHGLKILNKSYSSYSVEFKKTAIKRILINDEPATQVSLDLGLLSLGMIFNWLRKYKEDEDNVINHKKGRPSHEKQRPTNPRVSKTSKRLKTADSQAYCRKRICKKIERLCFPKRKPKASMMTSNLLIILSCMAKILSTIRLASLPRISLALLSRLTMPVTSVCGFSFASHSAIPDAPITPTFILLTSLSLLSKIDQYLSQA